LKISKRNASSFQAKSEIAVTTRVVRSIGLVLVAVTAAALGLGVVGRLLADPTNVQRPAQANRAEFMRLKLDYAKGLLEGLTMERMDDIAKNARLLKEMSAAAQWEVPTVPSAEYNTLTGEFQRIADELGRQAKAKNLDGATLAYVRLTVNCVECHKVVRKTR
jgi:hypothetical protein